MKESSLIKLSQVASLLQSEIDSPQIRALPASFSSSLLTFLNSLVKQNLIQVQRGRERGRPYLLTTVAAIVLLQEMAKQIEVGKFPSKGFPLTATQVSQVSKKVSKHSFS